MDPGKPSPPSSAPENNGPMSPKVKIFNKKLNQNNFFCGKRHWEAYKISADLETGFFPNCWLLQDKSNCLARGYELSGVWCPEEKMNLRGQLTSASVCLSVYFSPTRPGFHSNILHLGNISRLPSSNFLPRSISQRGKVSKVLHLRAFWPPPPTPVLHLSHLES